MTNQHPITPPKDLLEQLSNSPDNWLHRITNAYQAGADRELEACCEWLERNYNYPATNYRADHPLRVARRPKPPSLKEQALAVLDDCADGLDGAHENVLRRALEALDD